MMMHPIIAADGENTFVVAIIVTWLVLCCIAGVIAENKGRSFAGAFFVSVLLSPLIGMVIALVQKPNEAVVEEERLATGASKKCPFCAELIKLEAVVCRYCGRDLPVATKGDNDMRMRTDPHELRRFAKFRKQLESHGVSKAKIEEMWNLQEQVPTASEPLAEAAGPTGAADDNQDTRRGSRSTLWIFGIAAAAVLSFAALIGAFIAPVQRDNPKTAANQAADKADQTTPLVKATPYQVRQWIALTQNIPIQTPSGEVIVLPIGTRLELVSEEGSYIHIRYAGTVYMISVDFAVRSTGY